VIFQKMKKIRKVEHAVEQKPKSDVFELIEEAHNMIDSKNTPEAKVIIKEIEKLYRKVAEQEKRLVGYELMELKNDIKIAMIS